MKKGSIGPSLNFLAQTLRSMKLCKTIKPLSDAVAELNSRKDVAGEWGYNLQNLIFDINEVPRGTMPNNVKNLQVILNVEIHVKEYGDDDICNPIIIRERNGIQEDYSFSLKIRGLSNQQKVVAHWHLDYDSKKNNEYIHPDFHLTFGGNGMKEEEDDENCVFGKTLILPSPRLFHPPMDAILGIDFVLRNFIKTNITEEIVNISQYKVAVREAQKCLWKPYMLAIARHWCKFLNCPNYKMEDLSLSKRYQPFLLD